jgi:hypothetical protein
MRHARNESAAMTELPSMWQVLLARLVAVLIIALIIAGLILYGLSPATRQEFCRDILARPGGPMAFRFILQPVMAAIAALHDGIKDARTGRAPYLWTILTNPEKRSGRLYEGLISTARIILLGLAMDGVYQFIVLKSFHPNQAVVVALVLAFFPYLLLRGPVARIARHRRGNA